MPEDGADDEILLGEVRTGMLRSSHAISQATAEQILGLVAGIKPRRFERPMPYVMSPERLTGVDCQMLGGSGARARVVGTVASRGSLCGGHAVQGSAYVRVRIGRNGRRLQWSYYLASPGIVETIGKVTHAGLVEGFASALSDTEILDLGSIAERVLEQIQIDDRLDQNPPFKSRRTRLRWLSSAASDSGHPIKLQLGPDVSRTVQLVAKDSSPAAIVAFCEDLALHDWLLTTLLSLIGDAQIGSRERTDAIARLEPAVNFLLHLWMPAARIESELVDLWRAMERRPGFTRQWLTAVNRIRDQLALAAVASFRT